MFQFPWLRLGVCILIEGEMLRGRSMFQIPQLGALELGGGFLW